MELSIGFESWQQGTGIIKKTGEIRLTSIIDGLNLDPRDNADFFPGAEVEVKVKFDPDPTPAVFHPLAGKLLVLAPPTIEPILSNLPAINGNIFVTIPIGCALTYYSTNEPDDDESGIVLGIVKPLNEIMESLLLAAGVPAGNIGLDDVTAEFDINFPIQKQGGGFIDLAGEVAYCAGSAGYLYCDKDNKIQYRRLDLDELSVIAVELGVNDREYLPQLDGSIPPGVVHAVGVRKRPLQFEQCTKNRYEIPQTLKQESEMCKYEYGEKTVDIYIPPPDPDDFGARTIVLQGYRVTESISETTGFIDNEWRLTTRVLNTKVFLGLNLIYEYIEEYSIRGIIAPELTDLTPLNSGYDYILENSRIEFSEYKYDAFDNVKELVILEWQPRAVIYPDGYSDPNQSGIFALQQSRDYYARWKQDGNNWTQEVGERKCRALVENGVSTGRETDQNAINARAFELIPTVESKTAISDNGDTIPPKPETWSGLDYEEEDNLEGFAEFGNSKKRLVLTVPYAFTVQQLENLGRLEGEIVWGRAYQYLIECDPSLFKTQEYPMPIVRVFGAGENRIFCADTIQWYHTPTEDYVGFAGIYLGISGG